MIEGVFCTELIEFKTRWPLHSNRSNNGPNFIT